MASSNNSALISRASAHTQKKFELIRNYIEPWAQKLMNNKACQGLVFIDCMCNSGLYYDDNGEIIEGTPLRVARVLREIAGQYRNKQVFLYFNDLDAEKTSLLQTKLPKETGNFHVEVTNKDANDLLISIGGHLNQPHLHYFLLYDPYDASIDWKALLPFFRHWGEVMINHMVSDPVRAITQVKKTITKEKYEGTYLTDFENLVPYGSNKAAYEKRIREIILKLKGARRYYIAGYPFFNTQNSQVYSLIHCTGNPIGFELFKKTAWQTFGAQSSNKNTHGAENQLTMPFDGSGVFTSATDDSCFHVTDIAKYLHAHFAGRQNVLLEDVWKPLETHPVFPSDGFRKQVRSELTNTYGVTFKKVRNQHTAKLETRVSFAGGTLLL